MPWAGPVTLIDPTSAPGGSARPGTVRIPVSATLAANEAMALRRRRGEPVLPLAFGESGLPVHPLLIAELASTAGAGAYGPVAGSERLRAAAAGYWNRRSLPTSPRSVVAGPAVRLCCSRCCSRSAETSHCRGPAGSAMPRRPG